MNKKFISYISFNQKENCGVKTGHLRKKFSYNAWCNNISRPMLLAARRWFLLQTDYYRICDRVIGIFNWRFLLQSLLFEWFSVTVNYSTASRLPLVNYSVGINHRSTIMRWNMVNTCFFAALTNICTMFHLKSLVIRSTEVHKWNDIHIITEVRKMV